MSVNIVQGETTIVKILHSDSRGTDDQRLRGFDLRFRERRGKQLARKKR